MDATQAIADLTEISSQVEQVALVGSGGAVLASTLGDDARAQRFVEAARRLLDEADAVREARGLAGLAQLEAATRDGSVFVVRDGERLIVATTKPDPTVGLVFYDLKHALRSVEEAAPKKRAAATKSPVRDSGPGEGAPGEPGGSPAKKRAPRKKKTDAAA